MEKDKVDIGKVRVRIIALDDRVVFMFRGESVGFGLNRTEYAAV